MGLFIVCVRVWLFSSIFMRYISLYRADGAAGWLHSLYWLDVVHLL